MSYRVILTAGEDGWVVAECPELPGCVTQGRTREEALENAREAIAGWLEVDAERAEPTRRDVEIVDVAV